MSVRPDLVPGAALHRLADDQAARVRRLLRTCLAGLAGCVAVAAILAVALRDRQFATDHPGSLGLDAALVALLAVLAAGAAGQAVRSARVRRLAERGPAGVPCTVERLAAATRMRADYLLVRRSGQDAPVLVRCERGAGITRLPERSPGVLLAAGRFGPVIIGTPDLPPIAGHAGRYERLLPRSLRSDWVRAATAARQPEVD